MKISELIAQLQNAQRLLGDLDAEVVIASIDGPLTPVDVEPMPSKDSFVLINTQER